MYSFKIECLDNCKKYIKKIRLSLLVNVKVKIKKRGLSLLVNVKSIKKETKR